MSLIEARVGAPLMGHEDAEEHAAFVDAVAARDGERATRVVRGHLRCTADRVTHSD